MIRMSFLPQRRGGRKGVLNILPRTLRLCGKIIFVFFVLLLTYAPSQAQEPEKVREFVYGVNAFTGLEYEGVSYPNAVDTLYLLADITNIVSPRESLVYFWPITNQVQVDWGKLNEKVEGTLEVVQRGTVVATVEQTKYVVQYPDGLGTGDAIVYTGEEALLQYEEFERQRIDFRDRVFAYYEATRQYRANLLEQTRNGTMEGEPPPPPAEPRPFLFFSTAAHDGFPLTLPAGRYQIRVRNPEGSIVPDSERNLITFAPIRAGVTYSIIPHDKYTFPEESKDPSQILYARAGSVFYLQPSNELEYNDSYLTHLSDPQSTRGNVDQHQWMPLRSIDAGTLEILVDGEVVERIERRNFVVRQITGAALGYEIHDQLTVEEERLRERRPDFAAYAVVVEPDRPSFSLRLVDESGAVVLGSEREVHLVRTDVAGNFYALPLLPLVFGLGLVVWRRNRFVAVNVDQDGDGKE